MKRGGDKSPMARVAVTKEEKKIVDWRGREDM